ncbi:MAG: hypothetical protein HYS98_02210 [Deltaproteobacteria bacterium]|nr:hypothetical protein [Deltaproteobacteria bacterium]
MKLAEDKLKDLENKSCFLNQQMGELQTDLSNNELKIENLKLQKIQLSDKLKETLNDETRAAQQCVEVSTKIEEFALFYKKNTEEIGKLKVSIKENENQLQSILLEKQSLALKLQELVLKIRYCVDEIREIYVMELEDYFQQISTEFNEVEYKQKQVALRKELKNLGEVPLSVIEEYEEKKQRFEFLTAQKLDLENSMQSLKKTIGKLDKLSKDKFVETFNKVNLEFQKIFPVLFRGGNAKLTLLEEDNPLESGVEIFARPPGKHLQHLNLLSGGEKAMTAIGLIFALFMIRPSPFCVLDEVDAPLDDANTDRYLNLIEELSQRTQFVVITHNKRTMSRADVLYGVTMETPGISKIVGVQFSSPFVQKLAEKPSSPAESILTV